MSLQSQEGPTQTAGKKRKLFHDSDTLGTKQTAVNARQVAVSAEEEDSGSDPETQSDDSYRKRQLVMPPARPLYNGGNSKGRRRESAFLTTQAFASGGMGASTILTLQINELISDVRLDYDAQLSQWEETTNRIRNIIEGLPVVPPMTVLEAEKSLQKASRIAVPFPQPRPGKDTNYKLEYLRPAEVKVVGSMPLKLGIKGEQNSVDLNVTMPQSMFQDKDYLNYRFFHKRAYYLACLAAGIKNEVKDELTLSYKHQNDIDFLPVLIVEPTRTSPRIFSAASFRIQILLSVSDDTFPVEKTLPTKNCVRAATILEPLKTPEPTPFYNSCLRSAASTATYNQIIQKAIRDCESFSDVCALGRIWLRQRGLGSSVAKGGFGPFEWTALCALLLQGGGVNGRPALSSKYTTLQLFKAILQFLAGKDLTMPMILNNPNLKMSTSDVPVFYDDRTGVNILFKMRPWSYQLLQHEAGLSVNALNSRTQDNFSTTLIMRADEALLKYDQVFRIDASEALNSSSGLEDMDKLKRKLYQVLHKGLGNRVKLLSIHSPEAGSWNLNKAYPKFAKERQIIDVGLIVVPEEVNRLVDHGPNAEDREASAEFRKFWGDKAELRRFRDGSISESLVWSEDSVVTLQIMKHLLQRHLQFLPSTITSFADRVEGLIMPDGGLNKAAQSFKVINDTFQNLATQLHQLEGLPLSMRSISPTDPQLRYSSLQSPLISSPILPASIIIQFEGSARWPDFLPAIQHTKIAFLTKLADVLSSSDPKVATRVGLENVPTAASGRLNTSFLDIIYPSPSLGLAPISFRLRVHHDREQILLEKALSNPNLHGSVRDELANALATYKQDFIASARHTTALRTLCTRLPALSPTIRLLKKWTSSHLISPPLTLPDELLELVAAKAFLSPAPWSTPSTPQTGFLRALVLLARWDWATEPLIVDFGSNNNSISSNDEMKTSQLAEIETRFEAWRKIDPGMNKVVMFVASSIDSTGVTWTQNARPPRVVAARLTALAKASVNVVKQNGLQMTDLDWKSLFMSPLTDFNFLIYLKKGPNSGDRRRGGKTSKYKNLALQEEGLDSLMKGSTATDDVMMRIGFDPVALFLNDLRTVLGPSVLFFHNVDQEDRNGTSSANVIAGLWNPQSLVQKPWRVRVPYSTIPVGASAHKETKKEKKIAIADGGEEEQQQFRESNDECDANGASEADTAVVINQAGILAEIAQLGEGMVERIEIVGQKR